MDEKESNLEKTYHKATKYSRRCADWSWKRMNYLAQRCTDSIEKFLTF
jgi:hypothetical protein